jgi:hypothetical protein
MKAALIALAAVYAVMLWTWKQELFTSLALLLRWRGDSSEHAQRMRREHGSRLINFVLSPLLVPVNWLVFLGVFLFVNWVSR